MCEHEAVIKMFHLCMWYLRFADANYKIINLMHFPLSNTFLLEENIFLNDYEMTHLIIQLNSIIFICFQNLKYNYWQQLLPIFKVCKPESSFCLVSLEAQNRNKFQLDQIYSLSLPQIKYIYRLFTQQFPCSTTFLHG